MLANWRLVAHAASWLVSSPSGMGPFVFPDAVEFDRFGVGGVVVVWGLLVLGDVFPVEELWLVPLVIAAGGLSLGGVRLVGVECEKAFCEVVQARAALRVQSSCGPCCRCVRASRVGL